MDEIYKLLSMAEAAEFLGLDAKLLTARRYRGEIALPCVRLGHRTVRYRSGDVMLVASGERPIFKLKEEAAWLSPYAKQAADAG